MTVTIMKNPMLNSPYEEPTRHCSLLSSGRYATARWGARACLRVSIRNWLHTFRKLLTTDTPRKS